MDRPTRKNALEWFRAAAGASDAEVDLVEGALLIAQGEYPDLDCAKYSQRLKEMGGEARATLAGSTTQQLEQFSRLFGGRWGFRGNRDDYYDPRNSFLNDVLDRRTGIPITLSLVYMEIGRAAGLELVGVGMPGHFLLRLAHPSDLYVDAFSQGALLTREDCARRLRELRPDLAFRLERLRPVGPRQILTRMLNNLLGIYIDREIFPKARAILEMISCLEPDQPGWLRQSALVHYHLKRYSRAIAELERYLESAPQAADRDEVDRQLMVLRQLRSTIN